MADSPSFLNWDVSLRSLRSLRLKPFFALGLSNCWDSCYSRLSWSFLLPRNGSSPIHFHSRAVQIIPLWFATALFSCKSFPRSCKSLFFGSRSLFFTSRCLFFTSNGHQVVFRGDFVVATGTFLLRSGIFLPSYGNFLFHDPSRLLSIAHFLPRAGNFFLQAPTLLSELVVA